MTQFTFEEALRVCNKKDVADKDMWHTDLQVTLNSDLLISCGYFYVRCRCQPSNSLS